MRPSLVGDGERDTSASLSLFLFACSFLSVLTVVFSFSSLDLDLELLLLLELLDLVLEELEEPLLDFFESGLWEEGDFLESDLDVLLSSFSFEASDVSVVTGGAGAVTSSFRSIGKALASSGKM